MKCSHALAKCGVLLEQWDVTQQQRRHAEESSSKYFTNGLGCHDSWRGINGMSVELRTTQTFWFVSVRFCSARLGLQCQWCVRRLAIPCTTRHVFNAYLAENVTRREWCDKSDASVLTTTATRHDATTATWSGQNGVGCQHSWRGINGMYVELRNTQAVNSNLKMNAASENKAIL